MSRDALAFRRSGVSPAFAWPRACERDRPWAKARSTRRRYSALKSRVRDIVQSVANAGLEWSADARNFRCQRVESRILICSKLELTICIL